LTGSNIFVGFQVLDRFVFIFNSERCYSTLQYRCTMITAGFLEIDGHFRVRENA